MGLLHTGSGGVGVRGTLGRRHRVSGNCNRKEMELWALISYTSYQLALSSGASGFVLLNFLDKMHQVIHAKVVSMRTE